MSVDIGEQVTDLGNGAVEYDGEILPAADFGIEPESYDGTYSEESDADRLSECQRWTALAQAMGVASVDAAADYANRNRHLEEMARRVGKFRQAQGAYKRTEIDHSYTRVSVNRILNGYGGRKGALQSADTNLWRASEELAEACAECPVEPDCTIKDQLIDKLEGSKTRSRFTRRVKSTNMRLSDQACRDLISTKRTR